MKKKVQPNTARIIEGLRDTGYSFDAAIADLVDNSIEAEAQSVLMLTIVRWSKLQMMAMGWISKLSKMPCGTAQIRKPNRGGWDGLGWA
jgi:hypothetical protein